MAVDLEMFIPSSGQGPNRGSSTASGSSPQLNSVLNSLMQTLQNNQVTFGERRDEVSSVRNQRADYTRDQAFADAQGLMAQQLAQSMQQAMTPINRGADAAGSSASSMRALLAQQAATDAAQSAAALGAQQAVQYGNISNQASGVLEMLTRPDDASLGALMEALRVQQAGRERRPEGGRVTNQPIGTSQNRQQQGVTPVANNRGVTPIRSPINSLATTPLQQAYVF